MEGLFEDVASPVVVGAGQSLNTNSAMTEPPFSDAVTVTVVFTFTSPVEIGTDALLSLAAIVTLAGAGTWAWSLLLRAMVIPPRSPCLFRDGRHGGLPIRVEPG